jgi:hypothetical protein
MLGQRNDIAIVALAEAIGGNALALRSLSLAKNYISAEGTKALGEPR